MRGADNLATFMRRLSRNSRELKTPEALTVCPDLQRELFYLYLID
jgi:hypothetical protein